MVSIPACHAGDPGSIPGEGAYFFFFLSLITFIFFNPINSLIIFYPEKIKLKNNGLNKNKLLTMKTFGI